MAFAINTEHLPCLRSYDIASSWEQRVVPIRGSTLKPLGKRASKHMQIIRRSLSGGEEAIACRLYNTDCVTYFKDGGIFLNHAGWVTQSTAKFMNKICPFGHIFLKDGHMMFQHGGGLYAIPNSGLMLGQGTTLLNPTTLLNTTTLLNPLPFKVHTIDRVAVKRVRAQHKQFKEYVINMCKLSGGEISTSGRLGGNGKLPLCRPDTDEGMQEWADMASEFMQDAATHRYDYPNRRYIRIAKPQAVARCIDNVMLKMYRDEVFVETTLPLGEYRKDAYKKYFR